MAGKKKVVPRQSRSVEHPADKVAKPKWEVKIGLSRATAPLTPFLRDGVFDAGKAYDVIARYGGKSHGVEFTDPDSGVVYRPKHVWKNPDGTYIESKRKELADIERNTGKKSQFYDVPLHAPGKGSMGEYADPTSRVKKIRSLDKAKKEGPKRVTQIKSHAELPHVRVKTVFDVAGGKMKKLEETLLGIGTRKLKTIGEARDYSRGMAEEKRIAEIKDPHTRARLRRELEEKTRRNQEATAQTRRDVLHPKQPKQPKPAKAVVEKPPKVQKTKRGSVYKDGMYLAPSQHVTKFDPNFSTSRLVWNISARRRAQMEVNETKRARRAQRRKFKRLAKAEYRAAIRATRHAKAVANRRQKERLREPGRRTLKRMLAHGNLVRQIRNFQQFMGKGPLKLQLKGRQWATGARFNKALKSLPHGERYPAFGHSSATPMQRPVSMAPVSGNLNLSTPRNGQASRAPRTAVFATAQTVAGRGGSGAGVFFRIDADNVIANLSERYPQAMAVAAQSAADSVGKKLLDLVEPYVPKDTGLMYTTAQTNVGQTGGGLVDIDGAEAYPSSQMFGVSISYNTPYAEDVYFDESKLHGAAYNREHGTSEKGEKETARWIEAAFQDRAASVQGLLGDYARIVTASLETAGLRQVGFRTKAGGNVNFIAKGR